MLNVYYFFSAAQPPYLPTEIEIATRENTACGGSRVVECERLGEKPEQYRYGDCVSFGLVRRMVERQNWKETTMNRESSTGIGKNRGNERRA